MEVYWMINGIPILVNEVRAKKQLKVETWLDLFELESGLESTLKPEESSIKWVV